MIRDPFYRQIINGLSNTLDPELFEQCTVDLLRSIYPTIAPIKGGNDSGMDGAVADGEGEPFPLITTTSDKVMDNLTRNIRSYVSSGGTRRKIIFATSRSLTPKRIQNLFHRAKELKFTLIQVYSQDAIANLLYHNPRWCLELLNLAGDPAPLSIVPRTLRPLFNQEPIGQQDALSWLNQKNGDKILVGQPGSGKTFLLLKLALEGNGLFVISNNRNEITASIRAEQPEILIIDDAHIKLELLLDIKHIREITGARFEIIASCWPGDKYQVAETLNLSESSIFELDLLTRDQIVEVIKGAGLSGSNELIREIVNQSEGRPGLAVTLADICLKGGVKEVILGDTITKSILRFFGSKINSRTNEILATLSIGGDTGMQMLTIAQGLNLNIVDVRDVVTKLAAGGVVFEVNRDYLSVRPAILRYALIRDIFFKGALSIPIEPFLDKVSSLTQTAITLIGSVSRGATIPESLLVKILELANSSEAWLRYAWLGAEQSGWILEHHPERLIEIALPALSYIPNKIIPLLLKAAIGDKRELHSSPDHPLRLINDWIESGDPRTNEPTDRRELLLDIVLKWLQSKEDIDVGFIALKASLSPKFEIHTSDPGMGNTVTLSYGYLSLEHMIYIQDLWVKAFGSIKNFERINWRLLCDIVEEWAYCRVPVTPSKEVDDFMRSFAISAIKDIILIANNSMGVLRWTDEIASNLKANLNVPLNTEFDILYPQERLENWEQESINQASAVRELAKKWLNEDFDEIVKRIVTIENEAQMMKITYPRWTPFLCSEIAKESTQPCSWIRTMMENRMPCDLLEPFLKNAAIKNDIEWIDLAVECLKEPLFRYAAISIALTQNNCDEQLLARTLQNLKGFSSLIETLCVRNQISEYKIKKLLHHPDASIAIATAEGMWHAEPEETITESLKQEWRNVIVNATKEIYWLDKAFEQDHSLSYEWIRNYLNNDKYIHVGYRNNKTLISAIKVLDRNKKLEILNDVPVKKYGIEQFVFYLIGDDLELYDILLKKKELERIHLVPLSGYPGEEIWVQKVKVALNSGYLIEDIVNSAFHPVEIVVKEGPMSKIWNVWIEQFDPLCSNTDINIAKIGQLGREIATRRLKEALKEEKLEAVYGD